MEILTEPIASGMEFFILGCQRSGTTLLRLVLECHSKICCFDELMAYRILASGHYERPGGVDRVGFKIPRWTEQLTEPLLRDFGLAEEARNIYTGQPILFLQRDVRDTIVSMLNLRIGASCWLETWGLPILEWKINTQAAFRQKYAADIECWRNASDRLVASGALYWKYKNSAYLEHAARGFRLLRVRYEELVSESEPVLHRICEFLGVAFEDQLMNHSGMAHAELLEGGLAVGGTDPARSIDTRSVGQWKRVLTESQLQDIRSIAGDLEERLGKRSS